MSAREIAPCSPWGCRSYPDVGGLGGGVVAAGTVEDGAGAAVGIVTTPELAAGVTVGWNIDSYRAAAIFSTSIREPPSVRDGPGMEPAPP